jgi:hypothetical protein
MYGCVCARAQSRPALIDVFTEQTKSLVQPRGPADEWEQMQRMPEAVREWAQRGQAHSKERPGKVDLKAGSCAGYRELMTEISVPEP